MLPPVVRHSIVQRIIYTLLRPIHLLDLPIEVLAHILTNTTTARFSAAQSCQYLHSIICDIVGYSEVTIRTLTQAYKFNEMFPETRKNTKIIVTCLQNIFGLKESGDDIVSVLAGFKTSGIESLFGDIQDYGLCGLHSIDLSKASVTDASITTLGGIHTINLSYSAVTDHGLKALAGVHSINLNKCGKVTDEGVKALAGVHTINLNRLFRITDESVKALAGVHEISLVATRITNEGIKALVGVHTLNVSNTIVSDDGIKVLIGIHTLIASDTRVTGNVVVPWCTSI